MKRFSTLQSAVRAVEVLKKITRRFQKNTVDKRKISELARNYNVAKVVIIRKFQNEVYILMGDEYFTQWRHITNKEHTNQAQPIYRH